ncbi:putative thioesterase PNKD [Saccoglossus kowalevskii]|uniref:Probable hydrolase PNKD-like n=1 Tax=Saccoglossus kowalevskii TaxID=10224 RepID=A0ABM0M8A8_SACKO|nr:PREDICTED: probable hydrolase PNKD-like [Saccoglossus kowalevskii]
MLSLAAFIFMGVGVLLVCRRFIAKKTPMATKPGGVLFRIGYFLYTRTRLGYFYHLKNLSKAREKFPQGHSVVTPQEFNGLRICPVAMLDDNYSYVIVDTADKVAVVIDPSDPEAVQHCLQRENVTLQAILTTHKHWDHSGGNSTLKSIFRNIPVYGNPVDSIPGMTNPVSHDEKLQIGNLTFTAKCTPGHTIGHTVYLLDGASFTAPDCLFSGDVLFIGGAGRMFEGSPLTMLRSLDSVSELEDHVVIWPGHEYARDDLRFAISIDPDNQALQNKLKWVEERRKERLMTCPSTIGDEKTYNPFLRTANETIQNTLAIRSDTGEVEKMRTDTLAEIRHRKDTFSYRL